MVREVGEGGEVREGEVTGEVTSKNRVVGEGMTAESAIREAMTQVLTIGEAMAAEATIMTGMPTIREVMTAAAAIREVMTKMPAIGEAREGEEVDRGEGTKKDMTEAIWYHLEDISTRNKVNIILVIFCSNPNYSRGSVQYVQGVVTHCLL